MEIAPQLSDEVILRELGKRLSEVRLARNLTQAEVAEQAGVSKRTIGRLESGEVAVQLSALIRIYRALGLVARLDLLILESLPSPIEQLIREGRKRHRASGRKVGPPASRPWKWGDET